MLAAFASSSFAHAALTTTLVAALAERGLSTTTAAFLGSFMGVMQLPGRALMMHGRLAASPGVLLIVSLALLGSGMLVLTGAGTATMIGLGFAMFAGGAGLATLVRPYLVQTEFSLGRAGYLNGLLARAQQLARAAAPILAVTIGSTDRLPLALRADGAPVCRAGLRVAAVVGEDAISLIPPLE